MTGHLLWSSIRSAFSKNNWRESAQLIFLILRNCSRSIGPFGWPLFFLLFSSVYPLPFYIVFTSWFGIIHCNVSLFCEVIKIKPVIFCWSGTYAYSGTYFMLSMSTCMIFYLISETLQNVTCIVWPHLEVMRTLRLQIDMTNQFLPYQVIDCQWHLRMISCGVSMSIIDWFEVVNTKEYKYKLCIFQLSHSNSIASSVKLTIEEARHGVVLRLE